MVEKRKDSDRTREDGDEAIAPEADPTLDIVRQMIVQAEAIPPAAQRPRGPATPRPDRADVALPRAAAPRAGGAPEGTPEGTSAADPVVTPVADPLAAPVATTSAQEGAANRDGDWRTPDDEDLWEDDDPWDAGAEDGGWDDAPYAGAPRSYGIVDPGTGVRVSEEWVEDGAGTGSATERQARARRPSITGRLIVGLSRLVARLSGRLARFLWKAMRRLVSATARRVGAFLRRPDAPRRLALAILAFSIFVWTTEVLWLTLLIPLAALITWASVGNEGCVELVIAWFNRLKARDAAKAERIRARAAAVTHGLNRGLERLPQSWTQGLYLPDFETDGYVPEKLKVDPFEELAARVHSAKRAGEL